MREREGGTLSTYSTISQPYSLASLPPKQRNLMNDKVADKANKKMGDGRCNAAAAGSQAMLCQGATRGIGGASLERMLTGLVITYELIA